MRFTVYILSALVLFMIAGALPERNGAQLAVFRTPLFVMLLVALCACLVWCCRRRMKRRDIPFHLCHLGVVAILLGAFLGFWRGQQTQFAAPIALEHSIRELPGPDETTIPLDFGIAVPEFEVTYYSRSYNLYRPPAPDAKGDEAMNYTLLREIPIGEDDSLDMGDGSIVAVSDLRDAEGHFVPQHILPNGDLMQLSSGTPKHYRAVLKIEFEDRPNRTAELSVNHPVSVNGWRFYLMSYDHEAERYVVLSARRDPGRGLVIWGIWAVIVGITWLCWRRCEKSGRSGESRPVHRAVEPRDNMDKMDSVDEMGKTDGGHE